MKNVSVVFTIKNEVYEIGLLLEHKEGFTIGDLVEQRMKEVYNGEAQVMYWREKTEITRIEKRNAFPATLLCDFYKISHREQYPTGTEKIYATWTARTSRMKDVDKVIFFGLQAFIKEYLVDYFNENFFKRPLQDVVAEYKRVLKYTLGKDEVDASHIEALHNLGYLPIKISAVHEGTLVPIRVPMFTIENTVPEFFWVTNYLETLMSCMLWQPMTSATIALQYRQLLEKYARETNGDVSGVPFQGHDFSMRGMSSLESAKASGAGHLLSFVGTDTIPSILYMENYYNANVATELVGTSIPATEHSVQCCYGQEDEIGTFKRLINEIYPTGIMSIVSDTWDLWKVLTEYLPKIKDDIMARDGKVVIRPDSGNPADIVCGTAKIEYLTKDILCKHVNPNSYETVEDMLEDYIGNVRYSGKLEDRPESVYINYSNKTYRIDLEWRHCSYDGYWFMDVESVKEHTLTPEEKGVMQLLWETFGGEITEQGYKQLDPHIGCIYGDAITLERCKEICDRLKAKGFASTNMVYGIGSFTYQYNTRDTFGFALKTTYAVVNGEERFLFKNPITDNGVKKSQRGKVAVTYNKEEGIGYIDGLNAEQYNNTRNNLLRPVFEDGELFIDEDLQTIRERVQKHI